jgi:hypothetical protein
MFIFGFTFAPLILLHRVGVNDAQPGAPSHGNVSQYKCLSPIVAIDMDNMGFTVTAQYKCLLPIMTIDMDNMGFTVTAQ